MKKIIIILLFSAAFIQAFAQKENPLYNFYKEFYQADNKSSEEGFKSEFLLKFDQNSFESDFLMAVYSVFLNNKISSTKSESFKAFLLIQIMSKDDKSNPLFKLTGSELNAAYNQLKDQAEIDIVKMRLVNGGSELKEGTISIEESDWNKAKEYLGKYRIIKQYSN